MIIIMNSEQNFSNSEVMRNDVVSQNNNQLNSTNNNVNNNAINGVNTTINSNNKTSKSKRIILIILVILVIICVGVFIYNRFNENKFGKNFVDLNDTFDPDKPIKVKNNDKYGYITSDGNVIVEAKYNEAYDFYGEHAVVRVDNPDTTSYINEIYQIIDKKGNVILSSESYYKPIYYSNYGIWVIDETLYDSNLNKVLADEFTVDYVDNGYLEFFNSKTNESGIINYKGKVVFKWALSNIYVKVCSTNEDTDELFASVRSYDTYDVLAVVSLKTGDILFKIENSDDYYMHEVGDGLFYYYNRSVDDWYSNKIWLYFYNNKLAYQSNEKVSEIEVYDFKNQILRIDYGYDYDNNGKSQQYYYYDVNNQKMLLEKPETSIDLESVDLIELNYGYKEFRDSGKYGIMSGKKIILPCEYDDIDYINVDLYNYLKTKGKEIVVLEKDRQTVIMNLKNQKGLKVLDLSSVYDYDDSTFIKAKVYGDNKYIKKEYVIYNLLSEKSMTFDSDDEINIYSNYITYFNNGKTLYYNTEFKQIYTAT